MSCSASPPGDPGIELCARSADASVKNSWPLGLTGLWLDALVSRQQPQSHVPALHALAAEQTFCSSHRSSALSTGCSDVHRSLYAAAGSSAEMGDGLALGGGRGVLACVTSS